MIVKLLSVVGRLAPGVMCQYDDAKMITDLNVLQIHGVINIHGANSVMVMLFALSNTFAQPHTGVWSWCKTFLDSAHCLQSTTVGSCRKSRSGDVLARLTQGSDKNGLDQPAFSGTRKKAKISSNGSVATQNSLTSLCYNAPRNESQ